MPISKTPIAKPIDQKPIDQIDFMPTDYVAKSQIALHKNNFVTFLRKHFGEYRTDMLIKTYGVGTSKKFKNESGYGTVFWYQDAQKRLRSGKIMLYDADSGKRVKEPYNRISWVHIDKAFKYHACLFGEHLVPDNQQKPIAIVESEKSAIIASVYLPEYLWLASGGISNLRHDTVQALKGRTVVLFPDVDGFKQWTDKAEIIAQIATVSIYQHLERQADDTDRKAKYDIADYLLRIAPPPQEYTVEYERWCIENETQEL